MFLGQSVWLLLQARQYPLFVSHTHTHTPHPSRGSKFSRSFSSVLMLSVGIINACSTWLRWMWACFLVCPQSWITVVITGPLISLNAPRSYSRGTLVRSWLRGSMKYQSANHDCPLLWGQTASCDMVGIIEMLLTCFCIKNKQPWCTEHESSAVLNNTEQAEINPGVI